MLLRDLVKIVVLFWIYILQVCTMTLKKIILILESDERAADAPRYDSLLLLLILQIIY